MKHRLAHYSTALSILAVLFGWQFRHVLPLDPSSGLGYYLGIAGASIMLLLFLYPLKKKWGWLRIFGSNKSWFLLHIVLGLLGPTLILYHANFRVGSTNSRMALYFMLAVVVSGIIGFSLKDSAKYESLFTLWHLFHMPLFIMLALTATIHVVAVHMY